MLQKKKGSEQTLYLDSVRGSQGRLQKKGTTVLCPIWWEEGRMVLQKGTTYTEGQMHQRHDATGGVREPCDSQMLSELPCSQGTVTAFRPEWQSLCERTGFPASYWSLSAALQSRPLCKKRILPKCILGFYSQKYLHSKQKPEKTNGRRNNFLKLKQILKNCVVVRTLNIRCTFLTDLEVYNQALLSTGTMYSEEWLLGGPHS